MNTKSLLTRIGVPVLSLGLLGGLGATLATSASASTMATTLRAVSPSATVHAVTHSPGHLDTTSGPLTGVLKTSPNGPVWAYDNLSEQFTAVPVNLPDGANWSVTIDVTGSFQGFADPGANGTTTGNYGQPLVSSGPVHGTIQYDVKSDHAPDPKALPSQEPDGTGLGVALGQLFGITDGSSIFAQTAPPQVVGGGDYNFSYQNGNYVQSAVGNTSTITGDVTGH